MIAVIFDKRLQYHLQNIIIIRILNIEQFKRVHKNALDIILYLV